MQFRVISIGASASHALWNEREAVRTGHATTTLIQSGDRTILVDPGLPAQVLGARLNERSGKRLADITDVFLTSFHPDTRRALTELQHARWLISSEEREAVGGAIGAQIKHILESGAHREEGGASLLELLKNDIALLQKCEVAPDTIAERVDLFPLPGVTPGLSGLLLEGERFTTVICGDAVPTVEHLEQGKVPSVASDLDRARESFQDALEVADLLVLGRDNMVVNPTKRPF
jgi:glyoxylase-like metal-dependent hydrolase (beta-lactamase superfamily II)